MTIQEVKERKKELERHFANEIYRFEKETGAQVDYIHYRAGSITEQFLPTYDGEQVKVGEEVKDPEISLTITV